MLRKKNRLRISEKFYSLQGEGFTAGVPAVFLRLTGCNLLCKSDHWTCDTIEVWRVGDWYDFEDVLSEEEVEHLKNGAHLIITGGEPLLHLEAIVRYLQWYQDKYDQLPVVEIETNGTIMPTSWLMKAVFQWNVSPKLENSGESVKRRYNPKVLKCLSEHQRTWFKFVVTRAEDVHEIHHNFSDLIKPHQVMLMPAGSTQDELAETMPLVAELCKTFKHRFSPRLHIDIYNQKTGV